MENSSLNNGYDNWILKNGNPAPRTPHAKIDFNNKRENDYIQRGKRKDNWRRQDRNRDSILRNIRNMTITEQNDKEDMIVIKEEMGEIYPKT